VADLPSLLTFYNVHYASYYLTQHLQPNIIATITPAISTPSGRSCLQACGFALRRWVSYCTFAGFTFIRGVYAGTAVYRHACRVRCGHCLPYVQPAFRRGFAFLCASLGGDSGGVDVHLFPRVTASACASSLVALPLLALTAFCSLLLLPLPGVTAFTTLHACLLSTRTVDLWMAVRNIHVSWRFAAAPGGVLFVRIRHVRSWTGPADAYLVPRYPILWRAFIILR